MKLFRNKIYFFSFILLCALINSSCQGGIFRRGNQDENENEFMGLSFGAHKKPYSLPEGSTLIKDLAYGSDKEQKLDIFLPKKELLQNTAPVIFMVHGGAWMVGDKTYHPVVANKISRWLPQGIIFVSTNYRMSFSPNPLEQANDIARALNFIVTHASNYHINPNKIILMGHSAGAHLVSLISSNKKFTAEFPETKWLGTISLDSAAFDLTETMSAKHYRFYDRVFGTQRENWINNSPTQQLNSKISPMLLVCSTKRNDSCPQANTFAKKANELNSDVSVYPIDLKHGDINLNLGIEEKYTTDIENFMKKIKFL